jgi:hypothetical protein
MPAYAPIADMTGTSCRDVPIAAIIPRFIGHDGRVARSEVHAKSETRLLPQYAKCWIVHTANRPNFWRQMTTLFRQT